MIGPTVLTNTALSTSVYWDGDLVYFTDPSPGLIGDHIVCSVFIQFASVVFQLT